MLEKLPLELFVLRVYGQWRVVLPYLMNHFLTFPSFVTLQQPAREFPPNECF